MYVMQKTILIIDDEADIRMLIAGLLEDEGYRTLQASSSAQAYDFLQQEPVDLVVQDVWLQGSADDGIEILKKVKAHSPNLPFLMISGHGTIETAVSAIKLGAYDFIEKPFKSDRLLLMIGRAIEYAALKQQNADLKAKTDKALLSLIEQIPDSVRSVLDKAAVGNSRVFLTGEVGSGKMIAARYIHLQSARRDKPFMALNCRSDDAHNIEETLFGCRAGYRSGAEGRVGLLSLAHGGTLVLDHIEDLPIGVQGKLLHALQEGAFFPLGSSEHVHFDVRVISVCAEPIDNVVESGTFRADLFYRLNVVPIEMVALRNRKSDIEHMIKRYSSLSFTENAIALIKRYRWPGNIKELHNVLDWIDIMYQGKDTPIDTADLPPELREDRTIQTQQNAVSSDIFRTDELLNLNLREAREHFERYYLGLQINKYDGNVSKTATSIGMERSALHRKLKTLDMTGDERKDVA